ncbi:MAG: hypothetical protein RLZZ265_2648, partial [Verrucomicrobiota bacterium]
RGAREGGGDFDGGGGNADERGHVPVQHVELELAGGGLADELKVEFLLAQHDGRATVRGRVLVFVRGFLLGIAWFAVVVASVLVFAGGESQREDESEEGVEQSGVHSFYFWVWGMELAAARLACASAMRFSISAGWGEPAFQRSR